jgi:hypothetical protein
MEFQRREDGRIKVAYIAGSYRAPSVRGVAENIQAAEVVALRYWRMGYVVICPHKNTAFFDGGAPDRVWLEGDEELLRRSDVVVMMRGWEKSKGALHLARELAKEIIFDQDAGDAEHS